jgi:transcriptional regulator with XRE-family HTH domain
MFFKSFLIYFTLVFPHPISIIPIEAEKHMQAVQNILTELEERRRALGMSYRVLSERSGLGITTVQRVLRQHKGERLDTLVRIAQALGGQIGLVRPRTLRAMRKEQATRKAGAIVSMAQANAALEEQAVDEKSMKRIQRDIAESILRGSNHRLWV